jgi:hypothetical protein
MNTEEAIKANIYAQLNDMSKLDELCGRTCMAISSAIIILLNHGADLHIQELKKAIDELFIEAGKAAKAKQNVQ